MTKLADELEAPCRNCGGGQWVCENHADRPWNGTSNSKHACNCGGAGMPCGACNLEMASAGYVHRAIAAHRQSDEVARLREALEQVKRHTAKHPDDTSEDHARNCRRVYSIARAALETDGE